MGRRELRENIFKLLFVGAFNQAEEMTSQLGMYFENNVEDLKEDDQAYMVAKYQKISEKMDELDEAINTASTGWKTTRMGKVDLTILRLAVYEMKFDDDVPVRVAINEAVELAKKFGQDESPSFINGILGTISKGL